MSGEQARGIFVVPETPAHPVTIREPRREMTMYHVSNQELDELGSGFASVNSTFFGLTAGAFFTVAGVLVGVPISDPYLHAVFFIAAIVSLAATFYFLVRFLGDRSKSQEVVRRIRSEHEVGNYS